ncbi:hypothetical protein SBV1_420019 [Verrucomicrobia bacterium]|nr:hypothetical protein SBV1_420019 [Verrucomicrobiota bacterium]
MFFACQITAEFRALRALAKHILCPCGRCSLPPAEARAILRLKLAKADPDRADALAAKARAGRPTPQEHQELEDQSSNLKSGSSRMLLLDAAPSFRSLGFIFGLPACNVVLRAQYPILRHGDDVIRLGVVFAGTFVNVVVAPRVFRDRAIQVWSAPIPGVTRALHQSEKAVTSLGEAIIIHLESCQRCAKDLYLHLGFGSARTQGVLGKIGIYERRKRAQNDQHEQHFDKGKSPAGSVTRVLLDVEFGFHSAEFW